MATLNLSASASYTGSKRTVKAEINSAYGATTGTVKFTSTYNKSPAGWIRIGLYLSNAGGTKLYDSGYKGNFSAFPAKNGSTKTVDISGLPKSGNIAIYLGIGNGHNNITDGKATGYLIKRGTPVISNPQMTNITRTTADASASMTDPAGGTQQNFYIECATNNFSNIVSTITGTSGTFTGLNANTVYYVRARGANEEATGYSSVMSFTTSGNAPSFNSFSVSHNNRENYLGFSYSVSYDNNDGYSSSSVVWGTNSSYNYGSTGVTTGSSSASISTTSLPLNTLIYYKVTIVSTTGRSVVRTGTINTYCPVPSGVSVSVSSRTTDSITITGVATAKTNCGIYTGKLTCGSLHYEYTWTTPTTSATLTHTFTGLSSDANYSCSFTAENNGGSTTSSGVTASTILKAPTITNITTSNITPFGCTVTATATLSNPSRTIQYRFSKDNGATWTSYSNTNNYSWNNLVPETTYNIVVEARGVATSANPVANIASRGITVVTPADQAKIRIYNGSSWIQGKTYVYDGSSWRKAKKVYIFDGSVWKINSNN